MCPHCGALERHRLVALYLRSLRVLGSEGLRVLHVAPEECLAHILQRLPAVDYVSGDLDDPRAMVKLDVTALPFRDESIDVVFCNHVLEHVADERRALAEIYRVLRPGGWALLQSALDPCLEATREDPEVVGPRERERLFGQRDHVRLYGRDYGARLARAGFEVTVTAPEELVRAEQMARYGLLSDEDLYRCEKPCAGLPQRAERASSRPLRATGRPTPDA
jgi:SAM-dependent methyltransferase